MRGCQRILVAVVTISFTVCLVTAQPLAFPDAEGWAAESAGGRGGAIHIVSTLDKDGPGSLKEAIEAEGPRTIVFDVGGVIDLEGSNLVIREPFVTVAGQTAPYPGITIIDGSLLVEKSHDVVIQHLRIRPGAARHVGEYWEPDGLTVNASYNVIVDHCSLSWAVDEILTATGPRFEGSTPDEWRANTSRQITFSNNVIAEGLSVATHAEGEHSKGSLIHDNTTDIAIVKNLYVSNTARSPIFKAGSRGVILNNIVYNPGTVAMHFSSVNEEWAEALALPNITRPEESWITVVGNQLHWGPENSVFGNPVPFFVTIDEFAVVPEFEGEVFLKLYLEDNLRFDHFGGLNPFIPELTNERGESVPQYLVDEKPIWSASFAPIPSETLSAYIVENVGARPWESDPVDDRIFSTWKSLTGSVINFETDVGGFSILEPSERASSWDSDDDGMPDAWEVLHGLDPNQADDARADLDVDGYTNLEVYLYELSGLRKSDRPELTFVRGTDRETLYWENLPSGGRIEQSTDLSDWIELDPDASISGERAVLIDPDLPVFFRWIKKD